jgi:predicted ATPase
MTESLVYRRTFVGREAEIHQLEAAFADAAAGRPALVIVVGEPGVGKTALCEQLAASVMARGGRTLVGHCYEEGSLALPYLGFVEALRSYVLARPLETLRKELGSGASDVARIVTEVRERLAIEAGRH